MKKRRLMAPLVDVEEKSFSLWIQSLACDVQPAKADQW